jgi:hypothetical protein
MADKFNRDIKRRFNLAFGVNRLPMFTAAIRDLEKDGHTQTAGALKAMLKEELAGQISGHGNKGA